VAEALPFEAVGAVASELTMLVTGVLVVFVLIG
jgi:hypothetical protein